MIKEIKADRTSWDNYFLQIAQQVASRSTCLRKNVGAILVRDNQVLTSGYNGSIRGLSHCSDEGVGCLMENGHCVRTIHAEVNAIASASRNGVNINNSTCYCTLSPCWPCFKTLINAGINKIVYSEFYKDERIFEAAKTLNIELVHIVEKV